MTTLEKITPPLVETYGDKPLVHVLAKDMAARIDERHWDQDRGRERGVMLMCWNWFPGGDTAESVAAKIEAALA